ncbi:MAG TPA: hypothetical protein VHQ92_14885 [Pseudolabrys sp.]|nr:hypothetical protein [Pseudolabrys sp.]
MPVVACVATFAAWHSAHAAFPAYSLPGATPLRGHQSGEEKRSSVGSEIDVD